MPSLLRDRFLRIDAARACDLATGAVMALDDLDQSGGESEPVPPLLLEVLDHGRDGQPRAVIADVGGAIGGKTLAARIADAACVRGYVPIDVGVYARTRDFLQQDIASRTLVLLAPERMSTAGRAALLDAAMRSPRPHVLVTLRTGRPGAAAEVREARAVYGQPRRRVAAPVPADVLQLLQRAARAPDFIGVGRHAAAERLLRDVAAALNRRSAWSQASGVFLSLGRLLIDRARPHDAARAFQDAVASAVSAGDERRAVEARLWLASARIDAAELTGAESICRSLLLVGTLPPALGAWARAVLIRVLLWQDRLPEAEGLRMATPSLDDLDPEIEAFVRSTDSRLLLRLGRIFDAGLVAGQGPLRPENSITRVIALTSQLRVTAASGDLVEAEARLIEIARLARRARVPLRLVRARVVWADVLRLAGRVQEADRELRALSRLGRGLPPLLRQAIERRVAVPLEAPRQAHVIHWPSSHDGAAATLVRLTQEEDDDGVGIDRALEATARRLDALRIDLWSADAGPATIVRTCGTGLPSTIGGRVIDAGIAIGSTGSNEPSQLGVPVRLGARLLGALVARWPVDATPPPGAQAVLELLAAVAAPRVDGLLHRARTEAEAATLIPELVGMSQAMAEVRRAVARAAAAPFSVLIEGESGVGKELIARAVHYLSARRERRFCDVNCAALPDELIESELFGHARGAFTGAVADRPGLFEEAHGGTLFLDEVADLSLRAQAKLLRVVQQQEIRRVGETFARPVDVRLVAAANRNMRTEATSGRFRQDLLYRLDVIRIDVPALRDRPEDVPLLAQHFWRSAAARVGTAAALTPHVLSALATYHWPGNVRELQNVIAALAVAAPRRGRVGGELLPAAIAVATPPRTPCLADARLQFERRFVGAALARANGKRGQAARALGVTRQGLLKLIERLGLEEQRADHS